MLKAKTRNAIRMTKGDFVLQVIIYIFLTLILLVVAYPLYFVLISSISDPNAVAAGRVRFFPVGINLDGYRIVFERKDVMRGFGNSLIYTIVGTIINVVVTIPAGYALSRKDLRGRKYFMFYFMLTMFVSGGLIPTYLVISNLNMIDKIWALVIPGALSVYNMIIAISFFRTTIPDELLEAAKVDGCSNTRFFFRIVIPISGAIIAIMTLYYGVGHWNSYFNALIYITSPSKWPLQMVLRTILVQNRGAASEMVKDVAELQRQQKLAELMKYSLIVISSVPILIVYPFIQKHFVKGVMIGSIKG